MALFAGAGGLELGLKLALGDAYSTVCYVEGEAYAAAHLVARMEGGELDQAPIWDDVRTFDGKPWRGVVDLIAGGFPCQDISDAGLRAGILEGERSALWFEMARVIREVEPEWVFVENVDALLVLGLDIVLWSLAEMGFDAEWGVLGANDAGGPHYRKRTFILGHANRQHRRPSWTSGPQAWPAEQPVDAGSATAVANADGAGLRTVGFAPGPFAHDDLGDPVMGNTRRGRLEQPSDDVRPGRDRPGPHGQELGRSRGESPEAGEIPLWPFGREHEGEWPASLEPAVRRVADGMANWVDRIRLTGNGVVPVVAAMAFLRLRERLMDGL